MALDAGEQKLSEIVKKSSSEGKISGVDAFLLYDTFGFPLEITMDAAAEQNLQVSFYKTGWSTFFYFSFSDFHLLFCQQISWVTAKQ